ncbi:nitrite reductase/ring-hydroxylating ferredoxin subunit [Labedaea rhizosphaerae]|uniref:Nitrite reductase/ring-hydroxylating ferredoxin subunit n=2 Tax=Labedaea rhizosphaerae TaxID=598644 RepID=A0A4R6SJI2_LABRH|nr:nitrite reductase/ring-hydroxylating ferredoxin subunit [Labedaea rhizosphaerae]
MALVAPGAVLAACSTDSDSGGSPSDGAVKPGGVLAKVSDVPVGGGVLVDAGGRKLLLVQPTAGTVNAFDPACPHQGFTVSPPAGGTIVCPGHGSTFDAASGAVTKGPATSGLKQVPVKVSGGNVLAA